VVLVHCKETGESYEIWPSQADMDERVRKLTTGELPPEGELTRVTEYEADTLDDVETLRRQYTGPQRN
jgi:hypothetical protein